MHNLPRRSPSWTLNVHINSSFSPSSSNSAADMHPTCLCRCNYHHHGFPVTDVDTLPSPCPVEDPPSIRLLINSDQTPIQTLPQWGSQAHQASSFALPISRVSHGQLRTSALPSAPCHHSACVSSSPTSPTCSFPLSCDTRNISSSFQELPDHGQPAPVLQRNTHFELPGTGAPELHELPSGSPSSAPDLLSRRSTVSPMNSHWWSRNHQRTGKSKVGANLNSNDVDHDGQTESTNEVGNINQCDDNRTRVKHRVTIGDSSRRRFLCF